MKVIEGPAYWLSIGKDRLEAVYFRQQFGIANRFYDGMNRMQRDSRRDTLFC